jgi:hypothetical protein
MSLALVQARIEIFMESITTYRLTFIGKVGKFIR